MGSLADWFDPHSASGILAVVFGFGAATQALEFFTTLAATAPPVAAVAVVGLGLLVFLAWASARNGAFDDDESDDGGTTGEHGALAVLKERYARGELSEAEFEHRVNTLLSTDDSAENRAEAELETV